MIYFNIFICYIVIVQNYCTKITININIIIIIIIILCELKLDNNYLFCQFIYSFFNLKFIFFILRQLISLNNRYTVRNIYLYYKISFPKLYTIPKLLFNNLDSNGCDIFAANSTLYIWNACVITSLTGIKLLC